MAGPNRVVRTQNRPGSAQYTHLTEFNKLVQDVETLRSRVAPLVSLVNQLVYTSLYRPLGNPAFAISTNFDVKNANAVSYLNGGTLATLAANTNFDTGTAAVITANKWGAALLTVNAAGTAVVTWGSALAANSEALALAGLPLPGATDTVIGYIAVQASAGNTWTAGTDALQGGTGGNAAQTTHYYNALNLVDVNGRALVLSTTAASAAGITPANAMLAGQLVVTHAGSSVVIGAANAADPGDANSASLNTAAANDGLTL